MRACARGGETGSCSCLHAPRWPRCARLATVLGTLPNHACAGVTVITAAQGVVQANSVSTCTSCHASTPPARHHVVMVTRNAEGQQHGKARHGMPGAHLHVKHGARQLVQRVNHGDHFVLGQRDVRHTSLINVREQHLAAVEWWRSGRGQHQRHQHDDNSTVRPTVTRHAAAQAEVMRRVCPTRSL